MLGLGIAQYVLSLGFAEQCLKIGYILTLNSVLGLGMPQHCKNVG